MCTVVVSGCWECGCAWEGGGRGRMWCGWVLVGE
jgi:hypothetical protein